MTIETSWANHYKVGYNGRWFGMREAISDKFTMQLDGCGRKPASIAVECVNNARIMADKYGVSNIAVLYSGGQDSELILQSFIGAGLKPRVIFMDYGDDRNLYDKNYAERFCYHNRLKLEVINLDAVEFLKSGQALDISIKYQCNQSALAMYLWCAETLCQDYYTVLGDEPFFELYTNPLDNTRQWYFCVREWTYSQWKVYSMNKRDGCVNFIQYTAESFAAFMEDPCFQWLFNQTHYSTSEVSKYELYRQRFFMTARTKHSGMEKFAYLIHNINHRIHLDDPSGAGDDMMVPYQQLYSDLTNRLTVEQHKFFPTY